MLAPVLARLRRIPGIADVRVECSGTFFALSLEERADREVTLRAALDSLGPGARRLGSNPYGDASADRDCHPDVSQPRGPAVGVRGELRRQHPLRH